MNALLLVAMLAAAPPAAPSDVPPCPSSEERPDVLRLMQRTERVLEGRTSVAVMKMAIESKGVVRAVTLKAWTRGRDFALLRVVEGGPRETGMMTLKREKQLWNYLPQAGRVMKLPSGMLGDSWMGSDFTNDDLVRGASLANDFEARVLEAVVHEGRAAWRVELKPKANANVVWGRQELLLDRETCVPLSQRFFDEDGALVRTQGYSQLETVGWRTYPKVMTIVPLEQGRKTTLTYQSLELDVDVPDDTFSLRRLQQGRD